MTRKSIPIEERRVQATITLPIAMLRAVRAQAEDRRLTTSAVVVEALKAHLTVNSVPSTPRSLGQMITE